MIAGDNHVFRFNNPEEIRKIRDRALAKSSLSQTITVSDIEAVENTPVRNSLSFQDTQSSIMIYSQRDLILLFPLQETKVMQTGPLRSVKQHLHVWGWTLLLTPFQMMT